MNSRTRKFFSYYRPYIGLLTADLICAFIVSAITLALPLCIRYITIHILEQNAPDARSQIYVMGAVMLALVIIHTVCDIFISYKGHMMGATWKVT
ncbi:lipid A export ATP-binding/permease protein MsbA [Paenibacillus sp. JCM 10914]|nr:lipid A export ATP-binding/permease protein MsbA [Paenibacillus sp. JCM 10914]